MKKKIVLAGGSGFLGRALAKRFIRQNYEVVVLTRSPHQRNDGVKEIFWDAKTVGGWATALAGAEAVINLTGKSVDCRYHAKNRRAIISSRVDSTRAIGQAIGRCPSPPKTWLNASSATFYKHSFDKPKDESGETGATLEARDAFSIEVIQQWERTLDEAATPHTRKVALRAALVLGAEAGVFPVLRRLARWGLGGKMGSGKQMVSWIHEDDFCRAVECILAKENLTGPVNLTAPNPLSNHEMMRAICQQCGRPFGLPATAWMLEIGAFFLRTQTELILKSRFVVPGKLLASNFQFQYPELTGALQNLNS
jgi:uncharacterized protein